MTELLDVILTEYKELRQELRTLFRQQFTMITVTASAIGVLFGIGINIVVGTNNDPRYAVPIALMFCSFIPAISCFTGIIWLDQVYRQVKTGTYISYLEDKINLHLNCANMGMESPLYWEHWVNNETADKKFLQKTNQYHYYFSLGLFLLLPLICVGFGLYLINWSIKAALIPLFIFLLTYSLFCRFAFVFVKVILSYSKTIKDLIM